MLIRQETRSDFKEVYNVVKEAFATAQHADGNEQDLVAELRNGDSFISQLSLVAEVNNEIAGHILFTKGKVGDSTVLILAPLSILPKFQKQGIGTSLMNEGHRIAKELVYEYVLVLGSDKYYPRVGYMPAENFGIQIPDGIPTENFMAMKLQDNAANIKGPVSYAKEFGI